MAIERRTQTPGRTGISMPVRIVLGGLAVFGAITLVQWVLASLLAIVKFGVLVVVLAGAALWVVQAKGSR